MSIQFECHIAGQVLSEINDQLTPGRTERGTGIEESIKTGKIQDKLAVELMLIGSSSQKR